jgi:hypothetical protein
MNYVKQPGKKIDFKIFYSRVKGIHLKKYTYADNTFINMSTKMTIICPIHGEFNQLPSAHLYQKHGCPKCKGKSLSTSEFIEQCEKIHGFKYDYSKTIYNGIDKPITVICKKHGEFKQLAKNHRKGHSCKKCALKKSSVLLAKTNIEFINECMLLNPEYDYLDTKYINSSSKISVTCKKHGEFDQLAGNHLYKKNKCPMCCKTGFQYDAPAILYYIKDIKTGFYKIGITNRTTKERFSPLVENKDFIIIKIWAYKIGKFAYLAEQSILEAFKEKRIINESWNPVVSGSTEFFKNDILYLDKGIP